MAEGIQGKVESAEKAINETVEKVSQKITETVQEVGEWTAEKVASIGHGGEAHAADLAASIRERMEVVGSCGNRLGIVDHVEGNSIKLTKSSSPDGEHHFIPLNWVTRVDEHVHLNRDCTEAIQAWELV